jgi:transcriptional regulator with XRE-family HTH domain
LSRQAISHLEAVKNVPAWLTVQMLAKALDVPLDSLADPDLTLPDSERKEATGRPRNTPAPAAQSEPPAHSAAAEVGVTDPGSGGRRSRARWA